MCVYIHTHTKRNKIDANKILSQLHFLVGSKKQNKSAASFVNLRLMTSAHIRKNRLDDNFIESICIFKATTLLLYSEEKSLTKVAFTLVSSHPGPSKASVTFSS